MKSSGYRRGIIVALIAVATACSSNDSGSSSGTGGNGSGGNSAARGSVASGGAVGSGGTSASASASASASGGTVGSGGAGTGGSQSAGGSAGTGGNNSGGTSAGGSQSFGGSGGGGTSGAPAGGASAGGSSGSGGTAGAGGTTVATFDAGADSTDVNLQDAGADTVDGPNSIDWNAFLPLASGSTDNGDPGTTDDTSGNGYSATYGSGVTFSNSTMVLSGSGNVTILPQASGPAIDITASYSVSVWVTMTDTSGYRTFLSADGNEVSEFYLQQRGDTGNFAFTLTTSDSNDGANDPCVASSSIAPESNTLYHLVATRDATTGQDTLYVSGVVAGMRTCLASDGVGWKGNLFGIGRGVYNGSSTDYVSGSISAVGLVSRVLTADEVAALYALGPG